MFFCMKGYHLFEVTVQDLMIGMAQKMNKWRGLPPGILGGFSNSLAALIGWMLQPDHQSRPTAKIIQHMILIPESIDIQFRQPNGTLVPIKIGMMQ